MAGWIVPLVVLLFGLQIYALWRAVKRAMWIHGTLRDPQQLRGLLSSETLEALGEAGLDPGSPDIRQIQKSPDLQRLLAADLRKHVPRLKNPFGHIEPPEASAQAAHVSRPPPIDAASRSGPPMGLVLLLLGLAAGALAAALVRF